MKAGERRAPRRALSNYDERNGPLLAKGLAFSLLIGAVPLLFFVVSLRGYLGNPQIQEFITGQLLDFLPVDIRTELLNQITRVSARREALPAITIVVFAATSFNLFDNLERAMATMLDAERRKFWFGRAVSFLLMAGAIVLAYAAAVLSSVARLGAQFLTSRQTLAYASAKIVSGLLTAFLLTGLYYLFARRPLRFYRTFAVAAGCAIVWHIIGLASGWLVRQAGSRFLLYGAIASAVVILVFLRLLAEIIVVSSSIVAALSPPPDPPTARDELADEEPDGTVAVTGGAMANDTVFDKILAKEIPSEKVYEDDDIYAFKDINPQAPTHVLVLPKHRMTSFIDFKSADEQVIGRFIKGVAKVAEQLDLESDGYRIVFNTGRHGQQSVEYLHAHIIGGRPLEWPPG